VDAQDLLGGRVGQDFREALGLSLADIGRRLHVPRQNVQMFERAEATDRITLATLRKVAEAMGCSIGTVMSRLFYARRKMAVLLADLKTEDLQ